ncbi:MAG TPA: hypothetical protein VED63_07240 [Acidimicrobiales bacterium]|nr:hypothetical protein [Acidimicrobiales bacterium]
MAQIKVRPVEHEVVSRDMINHLGLSPADMKGHFADQSEVAVVKAVDRYGQKLTAVGDAQHWRELLASGEARDRDGVTLLQSHWPVLLRGWVETESPVGMTWNSLGLGGRC